MIEMDDVDPLLLNLVQAANTIVGFALDIVLTVPGLVVAGTLIGYQPWLAEIGRQLAPSHPPTSPVMGVLGTWYTALAQASSQDIQNRPVRLIHLANAQFLAGSAAEPTDIGVLWRGQLKHVSGWSAAISPRPGPPEWR
jgi:hypothetical protein